jgi:hypothetical protein
MKPFIFIVALTLISFSSAFAQLSNSSSEFDLKYQFTTGDQFQVKQHSQEDSYLDLDGVEQRTTNQLDDTMLLTVTNVNAAQATLEATFKQISLLSSSQDQSVSVNTNSDAKDVYNRLFKAMTGKKFTIIMQSNGIISSISGLNSIFDAMIGNAGVEAKDRETLKKFLDSQFGPEALKGSLALILPYYPNTPVQVNGTWTNRLYTNGFYNAHTDNYWKLAYGDKYSINLTNKALFSTDSTQEVDMGGGQKGYVDLTGKVQGQYMIDPSSGWPTMCITHTELKGDYIYINPKNGKGKIQVPVRVVKDASYQFKHF